MPIYAVSLAYVINPIVTAGCMNATIEQRFQQTFGFIALVDSRKEHWYHNQPSRLMALLSSLLTYQF